MVRKIIRTLAIALIVLPEPFTTALGILILSATFAFPRQVSLKRFGDLEELLKKSFRDEELFGFSRGSTADRVVVHHVLRLNLAALPENERGISESTRAAFQYHSWFDNRRISENVIHHVLKTSFPQYESLTDGGSGDCSTGPDGTNSQPAVEYHRLKLNLRSQPVGEPSGRGLTSQVFHHRLRGELVPNLN